MKLYLSFIDESRENMKDGQDSSKRRRTKHYPLPQPDYTVEPAKKLTKAMFDSEVNKLSKIKDRDVKEERKRR